MTAYQSLPLRPATVLRSETGANREANLTVLCADGRDCHISVAWWQTTAEGIAAAVEAAVQSLEDADADRAGALLSWEADIADPLY